MRKWNARQIILLGAMLLAVAYGAYDFLFAGRKAPVVADTAAADADMHAFLNEVNRAMKKDAPSPAQAHLIARAEAPWMRDPFYERKPPQEGDAAAEPLPAGGDAGAGAPKSPFTYTGFVESGNKRIAIVNGNEYAVGDALDVEGYVLKGISPSRITIHHQETRRTLDIPLLE